MVVGGLITSTLLTLLLLPLIWEWSETRAEARRVAAETADEAAERTANEAADKGVPPLQPTKETP